MLPANTAAEKYLHRSSLRFNLLHHPLRPPYEHSTVKHEAVVRGPMRPPCPPATSSYRPAFPHINTPVPPPPFQSVRQDHTPQNWKQIFLLLSLTLPVT